MDEIHGWKECPGPHCRLILLHITLFLHTIIYVSQGEDYNYIYTITRLSKSSA